MSSFWRQFIYNYFLSKHDGSDNSVQKTIYIHANGTSVSQDRSIANRVDLADRSFQSTRSLFSQFISPRIISQNATREQNKAGKMSHLDVFVYPNNVFTNMKNFGEINWKTLPLLYLAMFHCTWRYKPKINCLASIPTVASRSQFFPGLESESFPGGRLFLHTWKSFDLFSSL